MKKLVIHKLSKDLLFGFIVIILYFTIDKIMLICPDWTTGSSNNKFVLYSKIEFLFRLEFIRELD